MSKHIYHKYKLLNLTRDKKKPKYWVYVCQLPGCNHYIQAKLINGKVSICNRCGNLFDVNYAKLARGRLTVKPICDNCIRRTEKTLQKEVDIIDDLMKDILPQ